MDAQASPIVTFPGAFRRPACTPSFAARPASVVSLAEFRQSSPRQQTLQKIRLHESIATRLRQGLDACQFQIASLRQQLEANHG